LNYIKERGISQNLDKIELDKLSQYLGSYILERTKEDGGIMDTTTLHAIGKTNGNQDNQGNQGNQRDQGNQRNHGNQGNQGNQRNQGNQGNRGNQGNQ